MLIFHEGRLYVGSSSFAFPEGYRINDHPRISLSNGIALTMPDERITIDVNYEYTEKGAEEGLRETLPDFVRSAMKPRIFPGGTGWCAECWGDLYAYFEVRFDVQTGLRP